YARNVRRALARGVTTGVAYAYSAGDCAARGWWLWREITDRPGTVLCAPGPAYWSLCQNGHISRRRVFSGQAAFGGGTPSEDRIHTRWAAHSTPGPDVF